jgi:hypothetical protein
LGPLDFQCMSLSVSSETECDRIYNALAAGGTPIGPTIFAKHLGTLPTSSASRG